MKMLKLLVCKVVLTQSLSFLHQMENDIEVPKLTAHRVLKKNKYRPYVEHISQGLRFDDLDRITFFCNWFLEKCQENPQFPLKVLWSDESRFANYGVFIRS